ncbi:MAG: hypothetical protein GXY33_15510 [Phycisphaerae bacterium]|nr:hypothetical protein [Phycisphaerae bacterium]
MRNFLVMALLSTALLWICGCPEQSERQAAKDAGESVQQALAELESFARTSPLMEYSDQLAALPTTLPADGERQVKNIQQAADERIKRFEQAIAGLEQQLRDAPAEAAGVSINIALAHAVVADLRNFLALRQIDRYQLGNASLLAGLEEVRATASRIQMVKSQLSDLETLTLAEATQVAQKDVAELERKVGEVRQDISAVEGLTEDLETQLQERQNERENVNLEISGLTTRISALGAEEAVEVQKQINDLERQAFALSVKIDRLEAGPYELSADKQATLTDGRQLSTVEGLQQLREETQVLQTRLQSLDAALTAQKQYLENLESQSQINQQLVGQLSQRAEDLTASLKTSLDQVSGKLEQAQRTFEAAQRESSKARQSASSAQQAASRYSGAVRAAQGNVKPGQKDPHLELAQRTARVALVVSGEMIETLMGEARLLDIRRRQMDLVVPVLREAPVELGETLGAYVAEAEQAAADAAGKVAENVEKALETAEKAVNEASQEAKTLARVRLAEVYYQAALLMPDQTDSYLAQARTVVTEALAEKPDPNSPAAKPLNRLRTLLGVEEAS